jgi:mannose-6-phosphate isomerase
MTIELALTQALPRLWGVVDLRPWNKTSNSGVAIGEIWYDRPGNPSLRPSLLLKLLFTKEPLSIQVHPDDAYARSMGLPNGKTEAWYVLSAAPGARVALGLTGRLTRQQLRSAMDDGSIANHVKWQTVFPDDVIFVPAGTIHAIGAGLVIAEIQQRSEATFRLFDHGRQRELHIERAMVVANAGPALFRERPNRFTDQRVLLVSSSHFVLERIDLPANSTWCLEAKRETWLLVLSGNARAGSLEVVATDAVFAQSDRVNLRAGATGMVGLVAYTGIGPVAHLLQSLQSEPTDVARPATSTRTATPFTRTRAA